MMKTALQESIVLIQAVAFDALHCDQIDACGSFSSFHQTLTDHGTFDANNQETIIVPNDQM